MRHVLADSDGKAANAFLAPGLQLTDLGLAGSGEVGQDLLRPALVRAYHPGRAAHVVLDPATLAYVRRHATVEGLEAAHRETVELVERSGTRIFGAAEEVLTTGFRDRAAQRLQHALDTGGFRSAYDTPTYG